MTDFYVAAYSKGLLQGRHLIRAADKADAEIVFLRLYPRYRGMAIIVEGVWK